MEVPGRVDRTTPKSSDEEDLCCSPCKLDNKHKKADGYCEVCKEYLCSTCEDCHRKFRMTMTHRILKGSDIPYTSSLSPDSSCTDLCDKHPQEFIRYVCHYHNVLVCAPCTTIDHRTCKIGYIPDVAKTFKDSSEYKWLLSSLDQTGQKLDEIQQFVRKGRIESESRRNTIKKKIQTLRSEINTFLDSQEQELLAKESQFWKQNETVFDEVEKQEFEKRQKWQALICELDQEKKSLSQLFISARRIRPEVARIQTTVAGILRNSHIQKYTFWPSHTLNHMKTGGNVIGEIRWDSILSQLFGSFNSTA